MPKRLTEKQAWLELAERVSRMKVNENGRYDYDTEGKRDFCGLCDLIRCVGIPVSETLRERMLKKIYRLPNSKVKPGFKWSITTKYGNTQRRKFCLENAK